MPKKALTDRTLKALEPAAAGKRDMIWDAVLPSFGVRVTDKGRATFIIMRRMDGKLLRRTIGPSWQVPLKGVRELPFPLAEARTAAREALLDMSRGIDPKVKREVERREAQRRKQENNFAAVAEAFIDRHVKKLRSAVNVTSAIRQKLVPIWGGRAVSEISRSDVIKVVRENAVDHPYAAYHLLAYCKKLFGWALAQDCFGLEHSPCERIAATDLIGERKTRQRVLGDDELRKIWPTTAQERLGYPFGDLVRFLLFTGQRLREAANAAWPEFDLDRALWTIPPSRMKTDTAHEVPLAPAAVDLLRSLPRGLGPFVFSTTGGRRPVSGFSRAKTRLDGLLPGVEAWRFHDLRRTMRTHLGALPVPTNVAEMCIAHAQPGLHRVYDRHAYRDEKRRAFELWAERLLSIVQPDVAGKVVQLNAARG